MIREVKERKDMETTHMWDLSSLYLSETEWAEDFESVEEKRDRAVAFKGRLLDSGETLLQAIEAKLEVRRTIANVFTYARLKSDEDTRDQHWQSQVSRAEGMMVRIGESLSFFAPELLSGDPDQIREWIEEVPGLALYRHYLEDLIRNRDHVLSEKEEAILAGMGEIAMAPESTYSMLSGADLTFPEITVEDKPVTLTHGNFIPLMESGDREVRRAAFDAYYSVYASHINTFASLLSTEVKKNNFYAKTRHYPTARAAALFDDFIPESVYDALIEAVHDNLDVMHRYMALRKRALGVDELHMYDLYCPMVPEVDFQVEIGEAKDILLASFGPLGSDYTDVVESAFEEGWIDLYENKGKKSGAYSWGTYDSNPYILMNYHGTLDHVFTLGHEMGHAMHSFMTRKAQPYVYGSYSIFVAEVASTTNEALMTAHLLETLEEEEKKRYVLNHYLEQFRTTLFRQTMFAEFEREIHERADAGEALTAEALKTIYRRLNETYYGPDVVVDEAIALEWARIPHFYYNFYVFQYATGFSAAVALAEKLRSGDEKAVEAYLGFLSAGSSAYPIDVLRAAGADMTEKETVAKALEAFAKGVEQMESLL